MIEAAAPKWPAGAKKSLKMPVATMPGKSSRLANAEHRSGRYPSSDMSKNGHLAYLGCDRREAVVCRWVPNIRPTVQSVVTPRLILRSSVVDTSASWTLGSPASLPPLTPKRAPKSA